MLALTAALAAVALAAAADQHIHTHTCTWTSPQGNHYDLSALSSRTFQSPSSRYLEQHPIMQGAYEYTMNVCSNAEHVPKSCEHFKHTHPAPAFQASGHECFYLGDLRHVEWRQLNPHNPKHGVELVYKGGQTCGGGRPREIRYHFICSPHWSADEHPLLVHETPERCHYNVTWPSKHGCPVISYTNPHTWGFGDFLYYVAVLFLIYMVVGCCINVSRDDVPIGWAAMPNRDFWEGNVVRWCPTSVVRRMGAGGDASDPDSIRFERFPMKGERGSA